MYLKKRLFFTFQNVIILASIIPVMIFGFLTYNNSKEDSITATFEHIKTINLQQKKLILDYFEELEFNIYELTKTILFLEKQAKNNIVNIQALQKNNIQDYYHMAENDIIALSKKDIFQYIYNFLKRGKTVDSVYFENIKSYKNELGFKNILMINPSGKILYSSDQENIVGTYTSQLSSTFKSAFLKLKKDKNKTAVYFVNFAYEELSQQYRQYVITRFKDVKGFIAMEINQDKLQKSIADVASLGSSAETYLTYKDSSKTYLATNRMKKKGKVGDAKLGTHIDKGFESQGTDIKYGSYGDIELVGHMPINVKNIELSMQTTVAYTDIVSPTIKGSDYFEQFVKDYKYHNIMLIGPKGDIFYSVTKEDDYQTNIFNGKYSDTHLLKAVKEAIQTKAFVLTDLDIYLACSDKLAQFAVLPILKKDGTIQSIVVIQLDLKYLTNSLRENNKSAVYKSYESYIVGKDKKLRSDTLLNSKTHNVVKSFEANIRVGTEALNEATLVDSSVAKMKDYRGVEVLSSFSSISYPNIDWVVITEIDAIEIENMLSGLKNNILFFVFISSIAALIVMIFITNEKNKQDAKLHHTATHDSLTGLPNRQFALEFLSFMLANQKRHKNKGAVLFIDLDKFKVINDSYGHDAGDLVLIEVSRRLRKVLREEDLVARLGGDEFIVIINNYTVTSDLDRLCNKLINIASQPIHDDERSYEVGVSIGISTFPDDSSVAEELLQFSDTAMFRTKDDGRNGFTYYSREMTEKSLQVSRVEDELKYAIQNNELELYYQPQIDIENFKVVGVEALVRWNHPRDGFVMPSEFISIAEESNLIIDLGNWVTREACKAFQRWEKSGMELEYVAVNMSTKQLQAPSCVENITQIFKDLNFKPECLELEITENTLISNFESTVMNINTFKEMGIKFSIDDFGTGYSSLSYLKSLRITTLKIDREFIRDITLDKDDRAIVTAIIAMGHTLNYRIVAEGAETKEEIILLEYLNCDIVQGYYFSKPLAEVDLLSFVKNKKWIEG